jgi:aminoglycoside phosphotransferase (APT) family kinase protein
VSAEHPEINVALVSQLIASQFPQWAHLPVKPVEFSGWDNRTFHLGPSMSVRLPSAEGYVAQVEKEHRWLPMLAPHLPLPIPVPLVKGAPGHGYPWPWSVYRWLEGENATLERITDLSQFAISLAEFLLALQRIDATDGPPAGEHNFFRGGPLMIYDAETRETIQELAGEVDADAATRVWDAALETTGQGAPVWVHGDVAVGNLLIKTGRLSAVIDFGCSSIGDPACDLVMAWTFFSGESREAFRATLGLDQATWARARGWALWKALITLAEHIEGNPVKAAEARRVITEVLADHDQSR